MKIYFCGSIRGGRSDQLLYRRIVNALSRYGSVLTEHVACAELGDSGERGPAGGDRAIHDRDLAWLRSLTVRPDLVVAEVTRPSLGVGYELGRALDMEDKKVLCLFRPSSGRALSAMIRGAADGRRFLVVDYSEEQLEGVLDRFFSPDSTPSSRSLRPISHHGVVHRGRRVCLNL
ncbi:2'-deoxynucleoside 5'-phosphate N-hydrolase 1-like [Poeciliopsis prolifica]|uniref:2'-deoxynucleoside 5'-phosphate N-hydrolase 1-like n=1 Tax=Poeciliopsis prolifica TaxID=188132 RepID=UPI002413DBDC|nr:2'-deoxynucleoside 5'-phosphate N-hydrolase 1-like [Poeciliopsis prolifica]